MIEQLLHYGYFLVFIGVVVEGDATLIAAAVLAHQGHFSLTVVLLIAILASTATDEVFYWLALKRGRGMFERKAKDNPKLERVRHWVSRHGIPLLLFSRFIWGFRVAIPAACGATGMRRLTFSILNVAGALLWAFPLGFGGYGLALAFSRIFRHLGSQQGLMALALVTAATVAVVWHWRDLHDEAAAVRHPGDFPVEAAEEIYDENRTHHSRLLSLIRDDEERANHGS